MHNNRHTIIKTYAYNNILLDALCYSLYELHFKSDNTLHSCIYDKSEEYKLIDAINFCKRYTSVLISDSVWYPAVAKLVEPEFNNPWNDRPDKK